MPIAVFSDSGPRRLGKVVDDSIIDLSVSAPALPRTIMDFLAAGDAALEAFSAVKGDAASRLSLSSVRLHAPVPNPEKFLAIGMNYKEHAEEARRAGVPVPDSQLWFNKQVSCINDPFGDVVAPKPDVSQMV